jgi:hypothetical protein
MNMDAQMKQDAGAELLLEPSNIAQRRRGEANRQTFKRRKFP